MIQPWSNRFNFIITHKWCPDGTGAAWSIIHASCKACWESAKLDVQGTVVTDKDIFYLQHGADYIFPDLTGKRVLMVDCAPRTREEAITLHEQAEELVILDHHKSNKDILTGLDFAYFDMDRSGAELAWDYVIGKLNDGYDASHRPWFINIIGDRDIWQYRQANSREIGRAMHMKKCVTINGLTMLMAETPEQQAKTIDELTTYGTAAGDFQDWIIHGMENNAKRCVFFCKNEKKYNVMLVECNLRIASDVGNYFAEKYTNHEKDAMKIDFVVLVRFDLELDKTYFSLRASQESDIDLSVICRAHGGGGHPKAAGFEINGYNFMKNLKIGHKTNNDHELFALKTKYDEFGKKVLEVYNKANEINKKMMNDFDPTIEFCKQIENCIKIGTRAELNNDVIANQLKNLVDNLLPGVISDLEAKNMKVDEARDN